MTVTTVVDATVSTASAAAPAIKVAQDICNPQTDPYSCEYLSLYPEPEFGGTVQRFPTQPDNTCVNLTSPVTRAAGSVRNRLRTQAAILFDGQGCTGGSYRFGAGSSARDLGNVTFSQVVSVKFVVDECTGGQHLNACVFADAEWAGEVQILPKQPVDSCVQIAASLKGRVTSVLNNLRENGSSPRQDILLFSNDNCTGDAHRQNAWTGHPALNEIGYDNKARSIKFVQDPCKYGTSLCLWADVLYDGAAQVIDPQPAGACITLRPELRGQVSSFRNELYSPDRQDVALFAGDNCTGASKRLDAGSAKSSLAEIAFDNQARSVKFLTDSCRWGNSLCLYVDAYHEGAAQVIQSPSAGACINLRQELSAQVSSVRNWLIDYDVELFTGTGCTGDTRKLFAGNVEFNLAGTGFDNRTKSVKILQR
jgi:hypothetical protein